MGTPLSPRLIKSFKVVFQQLFDLAIAEGTGFGEVVPVKHSGPCLTCNSSVWSAVPRMGPP